MEGNGVVFCVDTPDVPSTSDKPVADVTSTLVANEVVEGVVDGLMDVTCLWET